MGSHLTDFEHRVLVKRVFVQGLEVHRNIEMQRVEMVVRIQIAKMSMRRRNQNVAA